MCVCVQVPVVPVKGQIWQTEEAPADFLKKAKKKRETDSSEDFSPSLIAH